MKEDLASLVEELLGKAEPSAVVSIAEEAVRTRRALRTKTSRPKHEFDQRHDDLEICLRLDGYLIEDGQLLRAEPDLEGGTAVEDDLTRGLTTCSLAEAREIIRLLNNSVEAFRKSEPDVVGTLTNARVALQTLATAIRVDWFEARGIG
jgi:hypothetical protein